MRRDDRFIGGRIRRTRVCPICGKYFDAKTNNIRLCNQCKQRFDRKGKRGRRFE